MRDLHRSTNCLENKGNPRVAHSPSHLQSTRPRSRPQLQITHNSHDLNRSRNVKLILTVENKPYKYVVLWLVVLHPTLVQNSCFSILFKTFYILQYIVFSNLTFTMAAELTFTQQVEEIMPKNFSEKVGVLDNYGYAGLNPMFESIAQCNGWVRRGLHTSSRSTWPSSTLHLQRWTQIQKWRRFALCLKESRSKPSQFYRSCCSLLILRMSEPSARSTTSRSPSYKRCTS